MLIHRVFNFIDIYHYSAGKHVGVLSLYQVLMLPFISLSEETAFTCVNSCIFQFISIKILDFDIFLEFYKNNSGSPMIQEVWILPELTRGSVFTLELDGESPSVIVRYNKL